METTEKKTNTQRRAVNPWKLSALLALVLLMAVLFSRRIGLQAESAVAPEASKAAPDFLIVKVGDFRAEIQWNNNSRKQE